MCQSLVTATVAVDCSAAEINVKLISKPRLPLSNDCTQVTK